MAACRYRRPVPSRPVGIEVAGEERGEVFPSGDGKMIDRSCAEEYVSALGVAILLQVLSVIFAAMASHSSFLLQIWWRSVVVYWGGFMMVLLRRPYTPTRIDLVLIEWGLLCLFVLTTIISGIVWRLAGVM